jgi:iron-sulfur cluster assembly protein
LLVLTTNAASAIRTLSDHPELPDDAGLRIAGPADSPDGLALAWAVAPQQEDNVVEQAGVRVFLDPTADDLLEDMVLDAQVETDGQVQFLLATQNR